MKGEYEELKLQVIYFEENIFLNKSGEWSSGGNEFVGDDGDMDWDAWGD